jgi:hypothetical protein
MTDLLFHEIACPSLTKTGPCNCQPAIVGDLRGALHAVQTTLQRFYNLTTWLLSEAPTGRLDEGASEGYHDALVALTNLRDELRRAKAIEHDEGFWHLGQKKRSEDALTVGAVARTAE